MSAGAFDAEEANGNFKFTGSPTRRTEAQSLDTVDEVTSRSVGSPDTASLTLRGTLSGGGGPSTTYAFALSTAADGSDAQASSHPLPHAHLSRSPHEHTQQPLCDMSRVAVRRTLTLGVQ